MHSLPRSRTQVLNARKTMLDISGDASGANTTISVANHHYAADFDAKFENVVSYHRLRESSLTGAYLLSRTVV